MPSPSEVAEFQALLLRLGGAGREALTRLFEAGEIDEDTFAAVVEPLSAASGNVTAQWYDNLAPEVAFAAEAAAVPVREALDLSVRWALSQADPLTALDMSAQKHIFDTSRETIIVNTDREGVRYARYASATACSFCRMLATRSGEWLYRSEKTARFKSDGTKYHQDCKCVAVPIRAGDSWTPPDYVSQWESDYENAYADDDVRGAKDTINHMRRADYARNKDRINAQQRAWYAARKSSTG